MNTLRVWALGSVPASTPSILYEAELVPPAAVREGRAGRALIQLWAHRLAMAIIITSRVLSDRTKGEIR